MTASLDSQAYPTTPVSPSASPAGYVTPSTPTTDNTPPFTAEEINSKRQNFIEMILRSVVQALTGAFLPGLGPAFDQLVSWVHVALPAQILAPISQLVQLLITALDLIPIFGPLAGDTLEYLANIFGLLNDNTTTAQGTGESAQITADSALALSALNAAQINSTGGRITDTFDRTAATSLGPNWDQSYMPGGVGTLGTNGTNDAAWVTSGAFHSWCTARHITPLTTNVQAASIVVATDVLLYSTGDSPEEWIILRCNAAKTEFVQAKIGAGYAEIGYVIGGTYTVLGTRLSGLTTTAGLWELRAGTIADDYEFVLLLGGNEVMRRTDASHASQRDASHLFAGFGQYTGGEIVFFFSFQGQPPNIQAFTAIDRTATA